MCRSRFFKINLSKLHVQHVHCVANQWLVHACRKIWHKPTDPHYSYSHIMAFSLLAVTFVVTFGGQKQQYSYIISILCIQSRACTHYPTKQLWSWWLASYVHTYIHSYNYYLSYVYVHGGWQKWFHHSIHCTALHIDVCLIATQCNVHMPPIVFWASLLISTGTNIYVYSYIIIMYITYMYIRKNLVMVPYPQHSYYLPICPRNT